MPKISLSTWSLFLKMNYRRAMNFAVHNGFGGVEIWSSPFDFWPRTVTSKEIDAIKSIARENKLSLAIHFCTIGNNLADLNAGHLNESMNQLKETIRLCRRIGGQVVVVHPGTCPDVSAHGENLLSPKLMPASLKQETIERFKKSLHEAARFAESHDVVIGLENSGPPGRAIQSTIEDLAEWVADINSPALQIALDLGHASVEGKMERAIHLFDRRIKHIHLHDSNGKGMDHGEIGTGNIQWNLVAGFLKDFPEMLSIEVQVREDIEGAVLRSKLYLDNLLKA